MSKRKPSGFGQRCSYRTRNSKVASRLLSLGCHLYKHDAIKGQWDFDDPRAPALAIMMQLSATERKDLLRNGFTCPPGEPPELHLPAIRKVWWDYNRHDHDWTVDPHGSHEENRKAVWTEQYRVQDWAWWEIPHGLGTGRRPEPTELLAYQDLGWHTDKPHPNRSIRVAQDRKHALRNRTMVARTTDLALHVPKRQEGSSLWLPTKRAAELLGVTAGTVRAWVRRDMVTVWQVGSKFHVRLEDVVWYAQRLAGAPLTTGPTDLMCLVRESELT